MLLVVGSLFAILFLIAIAAILSGLRARLRDGRPHVEVVEIDNDGILERHRE